MADPLFESLRALPARELDGAASQRVLRRARVVLMEDRPRGPMRALSVLWSRVLGPALVTGTVAVYLVWAMGTAASLYR
jgi:hypothetical protein